MQKNQIEPKKNDRTTKRISKSRWLQITLCVDRSLDMILVQCCEYNVHVLLQCTEFSVYSCTLYTHVHLYIKYMYCVFIFSQIRPSNSMRLSHKMHAYSRTMFYASRSDQMKIFLVEMRAINLHILQQQQQWQWQRQHSIRQLAFKHNVLQCVPNAIASYSICTLHIKLFCIFICCLPERSFVRSVRSFG